MKRWLSFLFGIWISVAAFCAEKSSNGLLAKGTKWETTFYQRDSGQPGPVVVLTGGIHGNEPAGTAAAEQIRHWPITRGMLIVIPRANVPGLRDGTRFLPGEPPQLRDLNRQFPKTKNATDARGILATALWEFVGEQKPDWVIDLHEGFDFNQLNSKSVGSTIIDAKGKAAAIVVPLMLQAVNAEITDPKKKLIRLRYPVDGSLARAAHERLAATAMILETTSKSQPLSLRARQHRLMVHALLKHLQMTADSPHVLVPTKTESLCVAIYDAGGVGGNGPRNLDRVLRGMKHVLVQRVGAEDIRGGTLSRFDLAIFPGGSGSKQAAALESKGRAAIQQFVKRGGGYLGICAGSYLAAANYEWSLGISNHRTFCKTIDLPKLGRKSMWYRGSSTTVKMELTEIGRKILGNQKDTLDVRYHNGPIMSPMGVEGLSRCWRARRDSGWDLEVVSRIIAVAAR
ncbi:MAG TPA: succinylglutamate desuccinylase/aspartoacylase family protein, partial [Verrucomicrobiota bacterium]|nr:succinylglutamate desuccinylase/aspartoacylase family protein [Verrucomicrobiota bacterium]